MQKSIVTGHGVNSNEADNTDKLSQWIEVMIMFLAVFTLIISMKTIRDCFDTNRDLDEIKYLYDIKNTNLVHFINQALKSNYTRYIVLQKFTKVNIINYSLLIFVFVNVSLVLSLCL